MDENLGRWKYSYENIYSYYNSVFMRPVTSIYKGCSNIWSEHSEKRRLLDGL